MTLPWPKTVQGMLATLAAALVILATKTQGPRRRAATACRRWGGRLPDGVSASVWDGQQVRQYVDGLRTNTTATTVTGSWTIYRWGWQFTGSEGLDEAYMPFFGAFGAAWDDAMVARWSANPLGMLWPEMDAAFVTSGGGGPPAAARRPVIIIAG